MEKWFVWILAFGLIILSVQAYPKASPDSSSESEESLTQQQQQQNVDTESLEAFTSQLKTNKGNAVEAPAKGEKLKSEDLGDDPCLDPKKIGPCKASMPRFFFNKETGKCQTFIFGGCGANRNNFRELTECETTCARHLRKPKPSSSGAAIAAVAVGEEEVSDLSICEKAPELGNTRCRAAKRRWTYNVTEGECVVFLYGGCRGTENNFLSQDICQEVCGKYEEWKSSSKKDDDKPKAYDETSVLLEGGDKPTTSNLKESISKDSSVCSLPKDIGNCYALMNKYFFNKEHNRCEKFEYGGCGGNQNNFDTVEDCIRTCGGDSPSEDAECSNIDCPWALYSHYTSFGCKPVYDGKACCPTRFDCPDKGESSSDGGNTIEGGRSLSVEDTGEVEVTSTSAGENRTCSYRGKLYSIGEPVTEASDTGSCRAECTCVDNLVDESRPPQISCAAIECPENFGVYSPGKDESCLPLYKRGGCCAYDFLCINNTLTIIEPGNNPEQQTPEGEERVEGFPFKCEVDGVSYYEGQRFYPKKFPCRKCICQKGFNKTFTSEFCEQIDCGIEIYYSDKLAKGCAPVYYQSDDGNPSCCPISWQCPDDKNKKPAPVVISPDPFSVPAPSESSVSTTSLPPRPPGLVIIGGNSNNNGSSSPPPMWSPKIISKTQESCSLPKEVGKCKGSRPRFYYNGETKTCEPFSYTGCGGNDNNFVQISDCQRLCENTGSNSGPGAEELLGRSGQQARSQDIPTLRIIQVTEVDPCTMPVRRGTCRGYFPRWFYSPESNSCQLFIFGGCRGNRNNFYSKDSCEAMCTNSIPVESLRSASSGGDSSTVNFGEEPHPSPSAAGEDDLCTLPSERGPCKELKRRFFYDSNAKQCRTFIYGGCEGNGNNFASARDCRSRCDPSVSGSNDRSSTLPPHPPPGPEYIPPEGANGTSQPPASSSSYLERCRLPVKSGSCPGIIPSYYFNVEKGKCQSFLYSGCFGNANRFGSMEECERTCKANNSNGPSGGETMIMPQEGGIGGRMSTSTSWRRPVGTNAENDDVVINHEANSPLRWRSGGNEGRPSGDKDKGFCKLAPSVGSCKSQTIRYHWSPQNGTCVPFVYSGCGGNKNNFRSESDCLSTCGNEPTIEQLTSEGVLSCTFGNETLPVGAFVGGSQMEFELDDREEESSQPSMPCGVPVCQCVTPPTVTCLQSACPPPAPLVPAISAERSCPTDKIIPDYSCDLTHCEESTDSEGCLVCTCTHPETDDDHEIQQVQVEDVFVKSVKG